MEVKRKKGGWPINCKGRKSQKIFQHKYIRQQIIYFSPKQFYRTKIELTKL